MVVANTFEEVISLIKDRLDIVEVVSQYVVLKKSGANYWGICPFHSDKRPSMSVSPSKGIYKCFSCGAGGDALNFLVRIQNREYKDVIFELAEKFGIELPKKFSSSNSNKSQKSDMLKACQKAAILYNTQLKSASDADKAMTILRKRGISDEIIADFTLGWAPNKYDTLYKELRKEFNEDILEKAGLILKSNNGGWIDRFRNRIIIPIRNENGDYIAFGARAVDDGQNPKYLNSSDSLIYNKSKTLFGLNSAKNTIKEQDFVVIMEGYFDVITAQANGVKNCVASCGTAMTSDHVKLLARYTKSRKIYLSFDTDQAGQNATKRGSDIIKETFSALGSVKQFDESHISSSENKYACEIRVVSPPQGKDPDEFIRSTGGEAFCQYVKEAPLLIDFLLNNVLKKRVDVKTPQEKSDLVMEIIEILKDVNNKIIQTEYVKMVASILEVNEKALLKELSKYENSLKTTIPIATSEKSVTNSSQFEIKVQKNLLSIFLSVGSNDFYKKINEMLPENIIQDETLIIVKNTIDKLTSTVNNVRELIKKLYTEFIENDNLTKMLTDLVEMAEAFSGLNDEELQQAVGENILRLKKCYAEHETTKMRNQYHEVNDDDIEALKLQIQLRDKIKLRTGDK
ncbi:MAG: DNA primase [bacterium]|nr:DNA primase [bacterium]